MVITSLNKIYITNFLEKAKSKIIIYTPWITNFGTNILKGVYAKKKDLHIDLYIRFIATDFVLGLSDLEGLNDLNRQGTKIRIFQNDLLHAKIYGIDNKEVIFGSANFTQQAFGHNYEIAFREKFSETFSELLLDWDKNFIEVTQMDINKMISEISNYKQNPDKLNELIESQDDFSKMRNSFYRLGLRQ